MEIVEIVLQSLNKNDDEEFRVDITENMDIDSLKQFLIAYWDQNLDCYLYKDEEMLEELSGQQQVSQVIENSEILFYYQGNKKPERKQQKYIYQNEDFERSMEVQLNQKMDQTKKVEQNTIKLIVNGQIVQDIQNPDQLKLNHLFEQIFPRGIQNYDIHFEINGYERCLDFPADQDKFIEKFVYENKLIIHQKQKLVQNFKIKKPQKEIQEQNTNSYHNNTQLTQKSQNIQIYENSQKIQNIVIKNKKQFDTQMNHQEIRNIHINQNINNQQKIVLNKKQQEQQITDNCNQRQGNQQINKYLFETAVLSQINQIND